MSADERRLSHGHAHLLPTGGSPRRPRPLGRRLCVRLPDVVGRAARGVLKGWLERVSCPVSRSTSTTAPTRSCPIFATSERWSASAPTGPRGPQSVSSTTADGASSCGRCACCARMTCRTTWLALYSVDTATSAARRARGAGRAPPGPIVTAVMLEADDAVNVLLVSAHPLADSYVAAVRSAAITGLEAAGHVVDVADLDAERFDPACPGGSGGAARPRRPRRPARRRRRPCGASSSGRTPLSSSIRRGGARSRRSSRAGSTADRRCGLPAATRLPARRPPSPQHPPPGVAAPMGHRSGSTPSRASPASAGAAPAAELLPPAGQDALDRALRRGPLGRRPAAGVPGAVEREMAELERITGARGRLRRAAGSRGRR